MSAYFKPWSWFTGEWQQIAFALCCSALSIPYRSLDVAAWWFWCAIFFWWNLYGQSRSP